MQVFLDHLLDHHFLIIINHLNFCWSLASYFTNFLVNELQEDVTYIDADIFFHQSVRDMLFKMAQKDIGIFRHRQYPINIPNPNGRFNVGVVHFKNTDLAQFNLVNIELLIKNNLMEKNLIKPLYIS